MKKGFYWHVHHDVLLEYCYNYQGRVGYIKENKPKNEIETRLRLFKPVKGKLPEDIVKAGQKYEKAIQQKYYETIEKHSSFIKNLHRKECGCKEWDGKEIIFTHSYSFSSSSSSSSSSSKGGER